MNKLYYIPYSHDEYFSSVTILVTAFSIEEAEQKIYNVLNEWGISLYKYRAETNYPSIRIQLQECKSWVVSNELNILEVDYAFR